ncbi:MAG TPA: TIGR02270 family protein, partial [Burkholderiaceae bacterium]|nr:TIGR02270 family protein [Burkholderiaceae bacterium]
MMLTAPVVPWRSDLGFAAAHISALNNRAIIETHVSEAAFLWRARTRAAHAPNFDLVHLGRLDERLIAHLEALRIAGRVGTETAQQSNDAGDPGDLFVLAWLACAHGDLAQLARLCALAAAQDGLAAALSSALTWQPWADVEPICTRLLASPVPVHRALALSVFVQRRTLPQGATGRFIADDEPAVRASTLTLVGALKCVNLVAQVRLALADPDAQVRLAAARALALMADDQADAALARCSSESVAAADELLPFLVQALEPQAARAWIGALAQSEGSRRLAIRASGLLGDTLAINWLIELMDDDAHARLAGEAFALITGADLDPLTLRRDPPAGFDADADAHAAHDGALGWPDRSKVARWWSAHRASLSAGHRYLCGQPRSMQGATEVLRRGYQ